MDKKMEMAQYAYQKVGLYRRKWDKDRSVKRVAEQGEWLEIPCIEKKDMVFAGVSAISDEHMGSMRQESCFALIHPEHPVFI